MYVWLPIVWTVALATLTLVVAILASSHALLRKRDIRAAIAWVGFIWFVPLGGSILYWWLGINRIQRRAKLLRRHFHLPQPVAAPERIQVGPWGNDRYHLPMAQLARAVGQVTRWPLLSGNQITLLEPLTAFAKILEAIQLAKQSVTLTTYIFEYDSHGEQIVMALSAARDRGVEVRVIVDSVGAKYSGRNVFRALRQFEIPAAEFIPQLAPWAFAYSNLRSHRKILVVDGQRGFTGGMNIRAGQWVDRSDPRAIEDLHFEVDGPVVAQMQYAFADDWFFCTGETLSGDNWFPPLPDVGAMLVRGIPDGPDEDLDNMRATLLAALSVAREQVNIITPYFLPDASLIAALNVTALRGVEVNILLPEKNNLRLVQWAATAQLWQVLERGCRVWMTPPPFDHTKLMVVDRSWVVLGSTNWDPRSLRLNFEFNLECYDLGLAAELDDRLRDKITRSREVTLAEVDGRTMPIRLRDGAARLLSPYL